MRKTLVLLALMACGGSNNPKPDAAVPPDVAITAVDCPTYCGQMKAHCTGTNAQYPDDPTCSAVCSSFSVGTSTDKDTSGNTLGCRINFAIAGASPANCASAGPAGDLMPLKDPAKAAGCSGGDVCTSYCKLEIQACGSVDSPLPGNPKNSDGIPLYQYLNDSDCTRLCADFDKSHTYSPGSKGDSLACRLAQAAVAVEAAMPDKATACNASGQIATGACAGAATP